MMIVNYDEFGRNFEEVPITYQNVVPGSYLLEITELNGNTRRIPLTADGTTLTTTLPMRAGGVPVVAHDSGEPHFTVGEKRGVLVSSLDEKVWVAAVQQARQERWDRKALQKYAQQFSPEAFERAIRMLLPAK